MNDIDMKVLEACSAYIACHREMLPQIAEAIGVAESEVFYRWMLRRDLRPGRLRNTDWTYFFHGYECDLRNQRDGRCLRVDFGPKGTVDILDTHGVLRFVMTSAAPWPAFPELKEYFATHASPYNGQSGDWEKMNRVWDRLDEAGFFRQANPDLVSLIAKYTSRGADGLTWVKFPPEVTEELRADCRVAHRLCLSSKATQQLSTHALKPNSYANTDLAQQFAATAVAT